MAAHALTVDDPASALDIATTAGVHATDVAMMEDEHDIALFVLAELAWYHRQACK